MVCKGKTFAHRPMCICVSVYFLKKPQPQSSLSFLIFSLSGAPNNDWTHLVHLFFSRWWLQGPSSLRARAPCCRTSPVCHAIVTLCCASSSSCHAFVTQAPQVVGQLFPSSHKRPKLSCNHSCCRTSPSSCCATNPHYCTSSLSHCTSSLCCASPQVFVLVPYVAA
jgi:hypothetical protein